MSGFEQMYEEMDTNEEEEVKTVRKDILAKAEKCVCGDRDQQYGSPENNFLTIAAMWNEYLYADVPATSIRKIITPVDVAMMMALLKICRIRTGTGTFDSFVDLAGYAACGGECEHGKTETE